jgi:two-component system, NtrC family, response regulator AtoC
MASGKSVTILTYNGLDGACAAAMVLLKHPAAPVVPTSANRIGDSLRDLARKPPSEVHVCGLGFWCTWQDIEEPARTMAEKGTTILWYCGRGYLDEDKEHLASVCTPVFIDAGTNTAAVAKYLELTDTPAAEILVALAWFDPHLGDTRHEAGLSKDQGDWCDLIEASLSTYFKYQDHEPYVEAIRKLARLEFDREARSAVEAFRQTGYRYMLHGRSPATRNLRERIKKCAEVNRHTLITGESGVGKEHVAHLLRERSGRAMGPFVPINCALYAGNTNLANSDLFGHVKGAFTGADQARQGKFTAADTGILYLDEIGDLPLEVQAKLLRVLEDGQVTPEGADKPTGSVDVRIIAATNRDLPVMIRDGGFRADLYHRLATLRVHVPPLRERPEDIKAIVMERLTLLEAQGYQRRLTKKELALLGEYDWPGNVRQLIKLIERAVFLDMSIEDVVEEEKGLGELVTYDDRARSDSGILLPRAKSDVLKLEDIKRLYARHVLELYDRNYSAAARALGIATNTLRAKCLGEE